MTQTLNPMKGLQLTNHKGRATLVVLASVIFIFSLNQRIWRRLEEAFFGRRGNGRAGSQIYVVFSSFFDAKMAEILAQHIYLSIA